MGAGGLKKKNQLKYAAKSERGGWGLKAIIAQILKIELIL